MTGWFEVATHRVTILNVETYESATVVAVTDVFVRSTQIHRSYESEFDDLTRITSDVCSVKEDKMIIFV